MSAEYIYIYVDHIFSGLFQKLILSSFFNMLLLLNDGQLCVGLSHKIQIK